MARLNKIILIPLVYRESTTPPQFFSEVIHRIPEKSRGFQNALLMYP